MILIKPRFYSRKRKHLQGGNHEKSLFHATLTRLIASDVNAESRDDVGREGFDYWQILVMTIVRHGCNYDYDKLQVLCEQHHALRHMLSIDDWNNKTSFHRRIILRETVPNGEKIFSIYESHMQLYRRGKAGRMFNPDAWFWFTKMRLDLSFLTVIYLRHLIECQ